MFNSTHTLVGFALSRTGMNRWTPYATWTAVIASNLPDIDIAAQFGGTASYIDHHRGFTHSIAFIPVLALLLALVMYKISGNRGKPAVPLWKHFAVAVIALATHPLLDWTNTYGVRPYLPINARWYYGDTLFIIDPYLDLILLIGVILSAHRKPAAWANLLVAMLYVGARVGSREIAERELAVYSRNVSAFRSSSVEPTMLNPFVWTGVVDTDTDISRIRIHLRTGETERVLRLRKTPPTRVSAAAEATHAGKVFRNFARFPVTQVEETRSGYRVLYIDFRFYRIGNLNATALAAEILLDRSLKIESESMSFTKPLPFATRGQ